MVPSPGPRRDDERQLERDGQVEHGAAGVIGTSSPPTPSTTDYRPAAVASRSEQPRGSSVAPASSAARCGETGGPKPCSSPRPGCCRRHASSSWSGGQSASGVRRAGHIGA